MDIGNALAIALRPLGVMLILWLLSPIPRAVRRWMPEGRLKRLLLRKVGD